jgi:hypothetical protein
MMSLNTPQTLRSKDGTVELSCGGTGAAAANDQAKDSRNGSGLGRILRIAAPAPAADWLGGIRLRAPSHWGSDLPTGKSTLAAANHNDLRRQIMPKSYSTHHPFPC